MSSNRAIISAENGLIKEITCPVTKKLFYNPARFDCDDEDFIEKEMGDRILASDKKCPTCQKPVKCVKLSQKLKNIVEAYLKEHPELISLRYQPELREVNQLKESKNDAVSQLTFIGHSSLFAPENDSDSSVIDNQIMADKSREPWRWDTMIRINLIGDQSSDKDILALRLNDKSFSKNYYPNVVIGNCHIKEFEASGRKIRIVVDYMHCGCNDRYRSMVNNYNKSAHAIAITYNVTDKESFENVRCWMRDVRTYSRPNVAILLIGTYCESERRVIESKEGQALAKELGIPFIECSAHMNINVDEAFTSLAISSIEKGSYEIRKDTRPKSNVPTERGSQHKCLVM